ncbi:ImmA/IrrE family metallo-endopeptidase [Cupriavidus sp. AcVe19-6a]|uniref:ImmA/IrrE family metallo-endopeptidase n=1 Tax=Cupriavidus sp. AcVe19-6a TaxID=2821358 RepID=UPI001AEB184C|nr:ImmA/IrrE family metallo-endopeptidase [Cupriavidus sp. AcVe19-6a]MBP0637991.1 ImmA/IrrE family metallo-endopeptidase [Cupriavidus sp. AcVe19-6a]
MTSEGERAESLIAELGITSPQDLDIEAVAFDSGVEVVYEAMTGCEASLVGYRDRAIATINPSATRGRERFSVAHELGHWHLHRGRSFQCRVDDPSANLSSDRALEKEADRFASHLLLPGPLFKPLIAQLKQPSFQQLTKIAAEFETSLMATALRLANIDTLPVVIASYSRDRKRWSLPAAHIPKRWFLKNKLDEDTFTYDLLHSGKECNGLRKQPADAWFENDDAGNYEVLEQCIGSTGGTALILLYLESAMMDAGADWNVGRRYTERGSYVSRQGILKR